MASIAIKDGQAAFLNPETGEYLWVPRDKIKTAQQDGLQPLSKEQLIQHQDEEKYDAPIKTGIASAMDTALLGIPGAIQSAAGLDTYKKHREHNPIAATVGDVAGAIGGALVPGGAIARAGAAASKVGAPLGKVAGMTTRAIGEGGVLGLGQGIQDLSTTNQKLGVDEKIKHLLESTLKGAAIGGGTSLGLSVIGGAAKRVLSPLRRLTMDTKTLAALREREVILAKEMGALRTDTKLTKMLDERMAMKGMVPKLTNPAELAGAKGKIIQLEKDIFHHTGNKEVVKLADELTSIPERIFDVRVKGFEGMANAIKLPAMAGGFYGLFSAESVVLGIAGMGASSVLKGLAPKLAKVPFEKIGLGASKAIRRLTETVMVKGLTKKDFDEIKRTLILENPEKVGAAASEGFKNGLDGALMDERRKGKFLSEMSGLQAKRVSFLQEKTSTLQNTTMGRKKLQNYLNAANDPQGILSRIKEKKVSKEDVEVLQALFPNTYAQLKANILMELGDKDIYDLPPKNRRQLALVLGNRNVGAGIILQEHYLKQQQEEQPKDRRQLKHFKEGATQSLVGIDKASQALS